MNTNPLTKGVLTENFVGIGTVTPEMVQKRAQELALINGRTLGDISQTDLEQAKRELTGESELDPKEAALESVDETSDGIPFQAPLVTRWPRQTRTVRTKKAVVSASSSPPRE